MFLGVSHCEVCGKVVFASLVATDKQSWTASDALESLTAAGSCTLNPRSVQSGLKLIRFISASCVSADQLSTFAVCSAASCSC